MSAKLSHTIAFVALSVGATSAAFALAGRVPRNKPADMTLFGGATCNPPGKPEDQYSFRTVAPNNVLGNLVRSNDYPDEALRQQQQGKVVVELDIAASGAATACRTYQSSGSPSLDSKTCQLAMERLRFEPAWSEEECGPIAAKTWAAVTWRL